MLRVFRSEIAWQAGVFVSANIAANALAVVSTAIVTRHLATSEFGTYAFAAATVLAQLLLVALFALAVGVGSGLSPASALALRGAAFTAAGLTCAFWLWPTFRRVRHWNRKFLHQARDWGFQVYIGRVL